MPHRPWLLPAGMTAGILVAATVVIGVRWLLDGSRGDAGEVVAEGSIAARQDVSVAPSLPWVAVLVMGLGMSAAETQAAITLPPEIGLVFSPYAADGATWQVRAQAAGHEILLELPLESTDPASVDPGPLALQVDDPPQAVIDGLHAVMQHGAGVTLLVGEAGAFAQRPDAFDPVAKVLGAEQVGLIQVAGTELGESCVRLGVPEMPSLVPFSVPRAKVLIWLRPS